MVSSENPKIWFGSGLTWEPSFCCLIRGGTPSWIFWPSLGSTCSEWIPFYLNRSKFIVISPVPECLANVPMERELLRVDMTRFVRSTVRTSPIAIYFMILLRGLSTCFQKKMATRYSTLEEQDRVMGCRSCPEVFESAHCN